MVVTATFTMMSPMEGESVCGHEGLSSFERRFNRAPPWQTACCLRDTVF